MKRVLLPLFLLATFAFTCQAQNTISTVAGGNPLTGTNPTATAIEGPYGLVRDASGNLFVLTDQGIIYKVTPATAAPSTISVYAGAITAGYSGDGGPASAALLNQPFMGTLDASGNLYFSDAGNCVIREINATTQVISTVAGNGTCGYSGDGGPAKSAEFNNPQGIAFDGAGNMYVVDCVNSVIRKINTSGVISTYAGVAGTTGYNDNVTALQATFDTPEGIASDANGNLYVADTYNNVIRYINASTLIVSTAIGTGAYQYSGDGGPATEAGLRQPFGVTLDGNANIYVADTVDAVIRKVDSSGTINTIIGNDAYGFGGDGGPALQATLTNPFQIAVDNAGDVWLTDYWNGRIRFYNANPNSLTINTIVGNGSIYDGGPALQSSLHFPRAPKLDANGNLYITDTQNNVVREVNSNGDINIVAGTQIPCAYPTAVCGDGGGPTDASFYGLRGIAFDNSGNLVVMDTNDSRVRKVVNGVVSTIAGNGTYGFSGDGGPATKAELSYPWAGGYDAKGNLYVLDAYNNRVRMIDTNGNISTVAGSGATGCGNGGYSGDNGPATSATLNCPIGLDVDAAGDLFISDYYNFVIRRVDKTGIITTVAGTPGKPGYSGDGGPATAATIAYADRVSVNAAGNLFISDSGNDVIRRVDVVTGIIETFAGNGKFAFAGDGGPALSASFATPTGVVVTNSGDLYVGDIFNNRVREVTLTPGATLAPATVPFGNQSQGTTSATQTVTLTDSGDAPLTISGASTTGDFAIQTNNCTATLATGASCTILVTFTPTTTGALTGTLTVTDNSLPNGTQAVNLTGTGTTQASGSALSITKSHTGNFTQGQANATYTVTVSNAAGAGATSGTVTVTDTVPTGLTLVTMAGTGWTCAVIPTCTRTDALAGGSSYPAITVTVNVGGSATSPQVNAVSVSGGGSATANATDSTVINPTTGATWTNTGSMATGRAENTATLLNSGKVLVAGGVTGSSTVTLMPVASAELYDPVAGTFSSAGTMTSPRAQFTASLLTTGTNAGDVLLAGGFSVTTSTALATAELYSPTGGTFTSTQGNMTISRVDHAATVLQNGQVLITGGVSASGGGIVASAELYTPASGTFAATGSMTTPRFNHTATLLNNGMVLIAGGRSTTGTYLDTAEIYNPTTATFTAVPGTMSSPREAHTATLLNDGTVLLAGGGDASTGFLTVTGTADIYDPASNTITPLTSALSVPRAYHTATLLTDGTVVLAGGGNSSDPSVGEFQALSSVEIYNPATKTFSLAASLNFGRGYQTATLLNSGAVLTEGGFNGNNTDYTILASAELYNASAATGPAASVSPTSLTFASQPINSYSAAQTVTLTNTGTANLVITSVAIGGTNETNFTISGGTCEAGGTGATVPPQENCTVLVKFNPPTATSFSATLTFTDNATPTTQTVTLSGTGVASGGTITLTPAIGSTIAFGSVPIGTVSAAQTVTITNTGTTPLALTNISDTPEDVFAILSGDCPTSLVPAPAAGSSCTVTINFEPFATGPVSGTLDIVTSDPKNGTAAITLSGTGVTSAAVVTLNPTSLTFASQPLHTTSAQQTVTLTNTGNVALTLTSIFITGTNAADFTESDNCASPIAVNAKCTIGITFTPSATGTRTASISITDNATGSPQTVPLTGTGASGNAPAVTLAPTSLTFASQNVGTTSPAQAVMLTNSGNAALTITGITITGANAGDFAETNTCPASLAAEANCSINVTFKPTASGARTASVSIADNATGSPQAVTLSGTGAATTSTVSVSPTAMQFQSQTLQTTSSPMNVTVTNTGTGAVQFTGFTISGTNSGDFALATGTCNASGSLAAGANCTIAVTFTPASAGARTATLSVADNATGSPQTVALSGTGVAAAVIVTVPSGGSTTATSVPGGTAYFGLILTGAPGVTGTVTLGCTPSSPTLTCSVIPSTVTLTPGGTTEVAFGVQTYCQGTTSNGALFGTGGRFGGRMGPMMLALLSLLMGFVMGTRRRNPRLALALAMVALIVIGGAACSGGLPKGPNGVTPAGTYSLTLTTTFNGQTQTYPNYLTLIVN